MHKDIRLPIASVAILLFWSSIFFLKFPLITIISLMILGLITVYLLFKSTSIKKAALLILINMLLWILTGIASSGITLDSLTPEYFRGEGRIFLYYLPIIIFSLLSTRIYDLIFLKRVIYSIAFINFILFLIWIFNPSAELLSIGKDFSAFISSHTGAGTYFGTIVIFITFQYLYHKNKINLLFFIISLFPLIFSSSRQALVAVAGVMVFYMLSEKKYLLLIKTAGIFFLATLLLLNMNIRSIERFQSIFSNEFFETLPMAVEQATQAENVKEEKLARGLSENESIVNALNRIVLWAKASEDFSRSPIVGIGFGKYNDIENDYFGMPGIFYFATSSKQNISDVTSAHNSYLHILSESGLLGLVLIILFWWYLYYHFKKMEKLSPSLTLYFKTARYLIIFICINGLFGHAFAAPALGFTALTIIAAIYAVKTPVLITITDKRIP
ncbi:oligosaccharide repeat unit polymerase Wzy [Hydrogenimonas sp.]|nr:oligosaccharide repeat unit polymerase Wzy [Hydrogenimonas sp.]